MNNISNRFEALSKSHQILIIILFISLIFMILEIGVRVSYSIFKIERGDPVLMQKELIYAPFVGFYHKPYSYYSDVLRTDRYGFIYNSEENRDLLTKNNDELRIFVLGGSTVAGSFEKSVYTSVTYLLEQKISQYFKKNNISLRPNVINAGVGGYFSSQEFALLKWYILDLKPDLLIFLDGSNEYSILWPRGSGSVYELLNGNIHAYHWNIFQSYNNMFSFFGLVSQSFQIMGEYSALFDVMLKLSKRSRYLLLKKSTKSNSSLQDADGMLEARLARYGKNILSSIAICKEFQIPVAYFLQPTLLKDTPNLTDSEILIINQYNPKSYYNINYFDGKKLFWDKASIMFSNLKKKYQKSPDVIIDDFSKILNGPRKTKKVSFYGDHVHYTDAARIVIVEEIMASLQPWLAKQKDAVSARRRATNLQY